MERHQIELDTGLDRPGTVIRYGHWGRPVVVFPSEQGRAWDYENNGMVGAVAELVEAGRVKLYCVDSFDQITWSDQSVPLEERAHRHGAYAAWVTDRVMGFVEHDSGQREAIATGCSMGAFHALVFGLTRADLFPVAICQSGSYDPSRWNAWGERGDASYFTNPTDFVPHLHGEHLDWLRSRANILLRRRRGSVGGAPHRVASAGQADGRPPRRARHPARAGHLGPRLRPRLAVVAEADRAPPPSLLLSAWAPVVSRRSLRDLLNQRRTLRCPPLRRRPPFRLYARAFKTWV